MKYEYLCGYESDFFTMPAEVIAVVRLDYCVQGLTEFSQIVECGKPVLAMRRIIKEPGIWTWEDKKVGRLPEVGCRAIWHDDNGMKYTVKIETAFFGNECAVSIDDEAIYFAEKFCLFPIETPAEKAQREEDEWVNKAWSETAVFAGVTKYEHDRLRIHLRHIYRAQLSGELAAPKGGE